MTPEPFPKSWTLMEHDERFIAIESLLGHTARYASVALGTTRSAVIGFAHRNGMSFGAKGREAVASEIMPPPPIRYAPPAKRGRRKAVGEPVRKAKRSPRTNVVKTPGTSGDSWRDKAHYWQPLEGSTPLPLVDLAPCHCRWPIGDSKPQLFCAESVAPKSSYCPTHKRQLSGSTRVLEDEI